MMAEPYIEIRELKEDMKALRKEMKAMEKERNDTKHYHGIEQDPRIDRIIAWIKKLEQRIK